MNWDIKNVRGGYRRSLYGLVRGDCFRVYNNEYDIENVKEGENKPNMGHIRGDHLMLQ